MTDTETVNGMILSLLSYSDYLSWTQSYHLAQEDQQSRGFIKKLNLRDERLIKITDFPVKDVLVIEG